MRDAAVRLEREKRKTLRQERLWSLLERPEVLGPLVGVGGALALSQLGKHRVINRDFAGFSLATWVVLSAAQSGITDKYALGALAAAATAAYAVATPPTEEEAFLTVEPGKLLGGDGKLFWWDLTWIPGIGPTT